MYAAILQSYLEGDQTALFALRDCALDLGLDDEAQMWAKAIQGCERIDSLTQAEERLLDIVAQHWMGVSHKTGPTDRALCEHLIDDVYQIVGLKPPEEKKWVQSPLELEKHKIDIEADHGVKKKVWGATTNVSLGIVSDKVWDTVLDRVHDRVQEQLSQQLVRRMQREKARGKKYILGFGTHDAYWLAFRHVFLLLGLKGTGKILPLIQFSRQCGWWMAGKNIVVLSDLPIACTENEIVYADGFAVTKGDSV